MQKGRASRTAEYMALFRALESSLPEAKRLFDDPMFSRPTTQIRKEPNEAY